MFSCCCWFWGVTKGSFTVRSIQVGAKWLNLEEVVVLFFLLKCSQSISMFGYPIILIFFAFFWLTGCFPNYSSKRPLKSAGQGISQLVIRTTAEYKCAQAMTLRNLVTDWLRITVNQSKQHYSLDYYIWFTQQKTCTLAYLMETRSFLQIIRQKDTDFDSYSKKLDACYILLWTIEDECCKQSEWASA